MSDEFPIDRDHTSLDFPLWTVVKDGDVCVMANPEYGTVFLLFTDEDLARQMIEHEEMVHARPERIPSDRHLRAYLTVFARHGGKHVGYDLCFINGRLRGAVLTPEWFLEQLPTDAGD